MFNKGHGMRSLNTDTHIPNQLLDAATKMIVENHNDYFAPITQSNFFVPYLCYLLYVAMMWGEDLLLS